MNRLSISRYRRILTVLVTFCLTLMTMPCVNAEETDPGSGQPVSEMPAEAEEEELGEPETEEPADEDAGEPADIEMPEEDEAPFETEPDEPSETETEESAEEAQTLTANGTWVHDKNGWWYRMGNGTYPVSQWLSVNGQNYYFDSRGYMLTGWQHINDSWYYLGNNGAMVSSVWVENYYLKADGVMAVSEWVDDGKYYVGTDGKWIPDRWVHNQNGWQYRLGDGTWLESRWLFINGKYYYFGSNGYMQTGWQYVNGSWYYLDSSGAMVSSIWIENYYLKADGVMAFSEWVDDGKYYVGEDGKWIKYYGITGWQRDSSGWWYSRGDGTYPISEWEYIDNKYYYFNKKGYMYTGWLLYGGHWYYLDRSGAMYTGWLKYNDKWYFMKDSGEMAVSEAVGEYYVDESGVWLKEYNRQLIVAEGISSENIFMKGIDISSWQGDIDLSYYKDGFVIIRASWGEHEDLKVRRNMDLCEQLGIPYGVYCYSYALSEEKAVDEADYLLAIIKDRDIQCGVWFDMEDSDGYKARNGINPTDSVISAMCRAFCGRITEAGYHAGIYASYNWFRNYITDCDEYDKWVAHWGVNDGELNINLSDFGVIHQYTSNPLDKNVMYVDLSHFADEAETDQE